MVAAAFAPWLGALIASLRGRLRRRLRRASRSPGESRRSLLAGLPTHGTPVTASQQVANSTGPDDRSDRTKAPSTGSRSMVTTVPSAIDLARARTGRRSHRPGRAPGRTASSARVSALVRAWSSVSKAITARTSPSGWAGERERRERVDLAGGAQQLGGGRPGRPRRPGTSRAPPHTCSESRSTADRARRPRRRPPSTSAAALLASTASTASAQVALVVAGQDQVPVPVDGDVRELRRDRRPRAIVASSSSPPTQTPVVASRAPGSRDSSALSCELVEVDDSGTPRVSDRPVVDWLSSSQSTVAGEKPYRSWRTSADSPIAVVDVRSASYPSSRSSVTSSPRRTPTPTSASSSSRTAAQSVQRAARRGLGRRVRQGPLEIGPVAGRCHQRTPTTAAEGEEDEGEHRRRPRR